MHRLEQADIARRRSHSPAYAHVQNKRAIQAALGLQPGSNYDALYCIYSKLKGSTSPADAEKIAECKRLFAVKRAIESNYDIKLGGGDHVEGLYD